MTRLGREIVRGYMRHVRGERFSPLWALLTPASWQLFREFGMEYP